MKSSGKVTGKSQKKIVEYQEREKTGKYQYSKLLGKYKDSTQKDWDVMKSTL